MDIAQQIGIWLAIILPIGRILYNINKDLKESRAKIHDKIDIVEEDITDIDKRLAIIEDRGERK